MNLNALITDEPVSSSGYIQQMSLVIAEGEQLGADLVTAECAWPHADTRFHHYYRSLAISDAIISHLIQARMDRHRHAF